MATMQKAALHLSNGFCAVIVGLWLGAAIEVAGVRKLVHEEQDRDALTRLVERTINSPEECR